MAPRAWRPRAGTPPLIALPCALENPPPQNPPLWWRSTQLPNSLLFKILATTRILATHTFTYISISISIYSYFSCCTSYTFLSLSLPYSYENVFKPLFCMTEFQYSLLSSIYKTNDIIYYIHTHIYININIFVSLRMICLGVRTIVRYTRHIPLLFPPFAASLYSRFTRVFISMRESELSGVE